MKLILFSLFALFILACETVVDVDVPEEPTRLVVNALISPDQDVGARVSLNKSVLDQDPRFSTVGDAQVILYEDGREVAQLAHQATGWYSASFRPRAGQSYTMQVSAEGLPSVEASTQISSPVTIDQLTVDTVREESGIECFNGDCQPLYRQEFRLQLQLSDPGEVINFYEIRGYAVMLDSISEYDSTGSFVEYDTLTRRQLVSFQTDDAVVNNSFSSVIDEEFYGNSLLFTDDIFSGEGYTVDFTTDGVNGYGSSSVLKKLTLVLRTLSEDQYQYLRTLDLQEFNNGDPFSEAVPVYNNIEDGFGIFAGSSADSVVMVIDEE